MQNIDRLVGGGLLLGLVRQSRALFWCPVVFWHCLHGCPLTVAETLYFVVFKRKVERWLTAQLLRRVKIRDAIGDGSFSGAEKSHGS
jgi:hypothetical protein